MADFVVKTAELLAAYLWIASQFSSSFLHHTLILHLYNHLCALISNAAQNQRECHYRQLMQVQNTLNRLDVFPEVIISSPHVSQTASFSLVLVKYHHTRLLVRMDVELLLLASCSEDNEYATTGSHFHNTWWLCLDPAQFPLTISIGINFVQYSVSIPSVSVSVVLIVLVSYRPSLNNTLK